MLKRDLSSVGWFPFINLVNHTPAKEVAYWSLGHLIHLPLKFLLNWAPWTWTHKFWPEMTAFHAFIKSDQILSWTSQKKEENDFKGSKGKVFVLLFVDFDPFLSFFFRFSFCYCGCDDRVLKMNSTIFTIFFFF